MCVRVVYVFLHSSALTTLVLHPTLPPPHSLPTPLSPHPTGLRIPGAMGRCRRGMPIWSKDGRLCACGLCPRASPARARALWIPGLEGTGGVRGEIPRQSENSRLIPVEMANPWLTDAGAGGACVGRWTWLMPSGFKGAGSPWFELEEGNVLIVTSV
jgi:hypothetical protein